MKLNIPTSKINSRVFPLKILEEIAEAPIDNPDSFFPCLAMHLFPDEYLCDDWGCIDCLVSEDNLSALKTHVRKEKIKLLEM